MAHLHPVLTHYLGARNIRRRYQPQCREDMRSKSSFSVSTMQVIVLHRKHWPLAELLVCVLFFASCIATALFSILLPFGVAFRGSYHDRLWEIFLTFFFLCFLETGVYCNHGAQMVA